MQSKLTSMPIHGSLPRIGAGSAMRRTAIALGALALATVVACPQAAAQNPAANTGQAGSSSSSFTDRLNNFFFGPPAQPGRGTAPDEHPECPTVDVRQGASTIPVYGPGEAVATNLRYQATIGQMARECAVLGATMKIKVGVQGRIILGPVGGPGQLQVPVRIALVHEGPEPKTLWTKLTKVPVAIPAGQTNVTFVHVEEDLAIPKPKAADVESYIIYVGFDQAEVKKPANVARKEKEFKERPLPSEGRGKGSGKRRGAR